MGSTSDVSKLFPPPIHICEETPSPSIHSSAFNMKSLRRRRRRRRAHVGDLSNKVFGFSANFHLRQPRHGQPRNEICVPEIVKDGDNEKKKKKKGKN